MPLSLASGEALRRREFIKFVGGAAATWPFVALAQQSERMRRIGVLLPSTADDPEFQGRFAAFKDALTQLGWVDGQNIGIDTRWTAADADLRRKFATELVALGPDVILAPGSSSVGPLLQNGKIYRPTLTASTKDLGDRVEIKIRGNGIGIPPEVKEKMFNPFFTTKPAGEGTGLGLSISHDIIVKQHGGSIEVDTQPGEFTEIRIVLPRTAASIPR
jgi:Histidine kinase-, DNA gyrase B-, and HSP90-like ATPase